MTNLGRIQATLGTPELAWFIRRLRSRAERGALLEGRLTVQPPSAREREALLRLLGRTGGVGATMKVDLDELAGWLRNAGLCANLYEGLEALGGPIVDRHAERRREEEAWAAALAEAAAGVPASAAVHRWLADVRAAGLLRRLAGGDAGRAAVLLRSCLSLASRLPAAGVPLATLAAEITGDSHALDAGEPLGTLAVRLAATIGGVESWDDTDARRGAWASVGVLCDELSAPVLVLNLRAEISTCTGRALRTHAEAGEPYRISTRQLLRDLPRFEVDRRTVFVCENPSVVAAAAVRYGARVAPLVCIEGQPKTASRLLLDVLARGGARLLYHGDFDWPGVTIANVVIRRHGAQPWRYDAQAYAATEGGCALEGDPVEAAWDARLTATMRDAGRAVHEEAVLDVLLPELV